KQPARRREPAPSVKRCPQRPFMRGGPPRLSRYSAISALSRSPVRCGIVSRVNYRRFAFVTLGPMNRQFLFKSSRNLEVLRSGSLVTARVTPPAIRKISLDCRLDRTVSHLCGRLCGQGLSRELGYFWLRRLGHAKRRSPGGDPGGCNGPGSRRED